MNLVDVHVRKLAGGALKSVESNSRAGAPPAVCWLLEGYEPGEGPNGRQTQVTRLRTGAERYLGIGEERADERRIQIGERQDRWALPQPHLCKDEQQPERIPVGGVVLPLTLRWRMRRSVEEALDERGDIAGGRHGVTSHRRSRRCAASSINRGRPRDTSKYRARRRDRGKWRALEVVCSTSLPSRYQSSSVRMAKR